MKEVVQGKIVETKPEIFEEEVAFVAKNKPAKAEAMKSAPKAAPVEKIDV